MYYDLWSQYIQVRKLFKGGNYSRAETICGNTVNKKFLTMATIGNVVMISSTIFTFVSVESIFAHTLSICIACTVYRTLDTASTFWKINLGLWPPIDLYLNFEIPSLKNQVCPTWFLIYFELGFCRLHRQCKLSSK
jgi:hypothetical protein